MAAKPIKSLELYYTMIQFLIIHIILYYVTQYESISYSHMDDNSITMSRSILGCDKVGGIVENTPK